MKQFLLLLCFVLASSDCLSADISIMATDLPPLKYVEQGEPRGVIVDVFKEMAVKMGEPLDSGSIKLLSWSRAYDDVKNVPYSILLGVARTKTRENEMKWVGPVYSIQLGFIGKKGRDFIVKDTSDAVKYSVGTLVNTAPEQILFSRGVSSDAVNRFRYLEQALLMLAEGRIELIAHTASSALYYLDQLGYDSSDYKVYHVIKDVDLYIGLNKDFDDDYVDRMQKALDDLKVVDKTGSSEYQRVVDKYFEQLKSGESQ